MNFAAELLLASFIGMACAAIAQAQIGNPAGLAPGTHETAPSFRHPPKQTKWIDLLSKHWLWPIARRLRQANWLPAKAHNAAVGRFARGMTDDHTQADNRLAELAKARNIIPYTPDAEQQVMQERLEKLSGAEFDTAYVQGQLTIHQKAATLLEWEIDSGENNKIKRFASQTLPVVFQHLQIAQTIQRRLTGARP
jgi:putative membrane protein